MNTPKKSMVKIDGVDVQAYLVGWEINITETNDKIRTISIVLSRKIDTLFDIYGSDIIDKEVIVTRGVDDPEETIIFKGIVIKTDLYKGTFIIECADKLSLAGKKNVICVYDADVDPSAGVVSEIFKDLINTHTGGALVCDDDSVVNTGDFIKIKKFVCKSESVYDKCKLLAELVGYNFYYDPVTDKVHFEPHGFLNQTTTISNETNIVTSPKWVTDDSDLANIIYLYGGFQNADTHIAGQIGVTTGFTQNSIQLPYPPISVRVLCDATDPPTTERLVGVPGRDVNYEVSVDVTKMQVVFDGTYTPNINDYAIVEINYAKSSPVVVDDTESITKYGEKEFILNKPNILTVEDAEIYATQYLEDHKEVEKSSTIRVVDISDLEVNQTVTVQDSPNNIFGTYRIQSLKMVHPYKYDEIKVSSRVSDEADYLMNIVDRFRQLERDQKDDFESLIRIKRFENDFIAEEVYVEVTKTSLTGTTGIYDSLAFGIWDTSTYEDPSVGSFILGHPTFGMLGTAQLGDGGRKVVNTFLENARKSYEETFYSDEFKDSATGDWDTTNGNVTLQDTENVVSAVFCLDIENSDLNCYKSCLVNVVGTGLTHLKLYIGEYDGITMTYTEFVLSGAVNNKNGSLTLTNNNLRGLSWKAEADGGAVVIEQLSIRYTK